ncbi:MAG: MetS family NSS transporter small subunit [bacterium]
MPVSAWLMLIFGCVVIYGGLGYCLYIARRNKNNSNE